MNLIPEIGTTDCLLVTDTVLVEEDEFSYIQIVEDTVFTSLTGTITIQGLWANANFAAGEIIVGRFTGFQLASGAVLAYRSTVPQA